MGLRRHPSNIILSQQQFNWQEKPQQQLSHPLLLSLFPFPAKEQGITWLKLELVGAWPLEGVGEQCCIRQVRQEASLPWFCQNCAREAALPDQMVGKVVNLAFRIILKCDNIGRWYKVRVTLC